MSNFEWQKDEAGNLVIHPYDGHQTATLTDRLVLLRLEYVVRPDTPSESREALQVALSRDQARKLSEQLQRVADAPHIPRPPSDARH